jgi:hypothetical protein
MTGASAQRWEPADEGVVVEAPNQPPPGGGQAEGGVQKDEGGGRKAETRPTTPDPIKPGEKTFDA